MGLQDKDVKDMELRDGAQNREAEVRGTELLGIMKKRRSVRNYAEREVTKEQLEQIVEAGLLSASGRSYRPWELIVVRDKEMLMKLSECREGAAKMLAGAGAAIVVLGNTEKSDTWIEDCSIVMSNMHLMADAMGLGSCWIQGRMRKCPDGRLTDEYVRELLGFQEELKLEAILSVGAIDEHPEGRVLGDEVYGKVHWEKF